MVCESRRRGHLAEKLRRVMSLRALPHRRGGGGGGGRSFDPASERTRGTEKDFQSFSATKGKETKASPSRPKSKDPTNPVDSGAENTATNTNPEDPGAENTAENTRPAEPGNNNTSTSISSNTHNPNPKDPGAENTATSTRPTQPGNNNTNTSTRPQPHQPCHNPPAPTTSPHQASPSGHALPEDYTAPAQTKHRDEDNKRKLPPNLLEHDTNRKYKAPESTTPTTNPQSTNPRIAGSRSVSYWTSTRASNRSSTLLQASDPSEMASTDDSAAAASTGQHSAAKASPTQQNLALRLATATSTPDGHTTASGAHTQSAAAGQPRGMDAADAEVDQDMAEEQGEAEDITITGPSPTARAHDDIRKFIVFSYPQGAIKAKRSQEGDNTTTFTIKIKMHDEGDLDMEGKTLNGAVQTNEDFANVIGRMTGSVLSHITDLPEEQLLIGNHENMTTTTATNGAALKVLVRNGKRAGKGIVLNCKVTEASGTQTHPTDFITKTGNYRARCDDTEIDFKITQTPMNGFTKKVPGAREVACRLTYIGYNGKPEDKGVRDEVLEQLLLELEASIQEDSTGAYVSVSTTGQYLALWVNMTIPAAQITDAAKNEAKANARQAFNNWKLAKAFTLKDFVFEVGAAAIASATTGNEPSRPFTVDDYQRLDRIANHGGDGFALKLWSSEGDVQEVKAFCDANTATYSTRRMLNTTTVIIYHCADKHHPIDQEAIYNQLMELIQGADSIEAATLTTTEKRQFKKKIKASRNAAEKAAKKQRTADDAELELHQTLTKQIRNSPATMQAIRSKNEAKYKKVESQVELDDAKTMAAQMQREIANAPMTHKATDSDSDTDL